MSWLYLSPHLDDAALSCGGLIWEQSHSGDEVSVWTICAGDPPTGPLSPFAESLHARWETGRQASAARRAEDIRSCAKLGASFHHFSIPDCIYRRSPKTGDALYGSEEALFGLVHPEETLLVSKLVRQLSRVFKKYADVACPLALGGHVDHRLVRAAAEKAGCGFWYYADYPYVLKEVPPSNLLQTPGCEERTFPVSKDGLSAWAASVAAHASQISTFWPDLAAMQAAIVKYCLEQCGVRLWRI
jgi:LmbE family N-acetylglucosaminyl deacetylase